MNNEPIVTVATITAGVAALIGLLVSFGLPITSDQQTAILAFIGIVAPFVVAFIARKFTVAYARTLAYSTKSGTVVAGEGSELPNGTPVEVSEQLDDEELPADDDLPPNPYGADEQPA